LEAILKRAGMKKQGKRYTLEKKIGDEKSYCVSILNPEEDVLGEVSMHMSNDWLEKISMKDLSIDEAKDFKEWFKTFRNKLLKAKIELEDIV